MDDVWTTHHEGEVEGRPIKVETHSSGSYKVSTTQAADTPGSISQDETTTVIIPPYAAGTPIEIEGETLDELRQNLSVDGDFSEASINDIVGHFPR